MPFAAEWGTVERSQSPDDSNIDRGTDLKGLKIYLEQLHTGRPPLLYDWTASLEDYRLDSVAVSRSDGEEIAHLPVFTPWAAWN